MLWTEVPTIIKIQSKGQLTIPSQLRAKVGLADGDLLEASAKDGKITLTPKLLVDRGAPKESRPQQRAKFIKELRDSAPPVLKEIWAESERKGLDKLTGREINSEIAAARREGRKKHKQTGR